MQEAATQCIRGKLKFPCGRAAAITGGITAKTRPGQNQNKWFCQPKQGGGKAYYYIGNNETIPSTMFNKSGGIIYGWN